MTPAPAGGGRPGRRGLALALVVLLAAACRSEEPVETAGPELLDLGADQIMVGMQHLVTREGILRARVEADTAFTFQDSALVHMRPLHVTFFGPEGREMSDLRAARGTYHLGSSDVRAEGDVVVIDRRKDQRLETESIVYDAMANELRSEEPFVLERPAGTLRGTGFVSDPEMDTVQVRRPAGEARGTEPPPADPLPPDTGPERRP